MSDRPRRQRGAPLPTDPTASGQLAFPALVQPGPLSAEAAPRPRDSNRGLERLGLALDQGALGGLSGRDMAINRLRGIWPDLVGDRMAERTDPLEVRSRALLVRADNAHWARSLRLLRSTLLHRIQRQPGCDRIQDLKVRIAPAVRPAAPTRPAAPAPTEQDRQEAAALCDGILHPELKAKLADILPGLLARNARADGSD